jgi:hypothetical protein
MKAGRILSLLALLALFLLAAYGCGKPKVETTKVSGKVTLDGAPLEKGTILFTAADNKAEPASGDIKDGQYALEVPPGPKIVKINATKVVGTKKKYADKDSANSPDVDVTKSIIPEIYNDNSQLKVDINAGTKELPPFELKSR